MLHTVSSTLQFTVAGNLVSSASLDAMKNVCRSAEKKGLISLVCFFRGKAKELQDIESGYYKNVKLRLLQPNQKKTEEVRVTA